MWLDVLDATEGGDERRGYTSCLATFNAGRSIGDEPTLMSILMRMAACNVGVDALERLLAANQLSEVDLRALQELLADESAQPFLLWAFRAERAALYETLNLAQTGELDGTNSGKEFYLHFSRWRRWLYTNAMMRRSQAILLRHLTRAVELSKLPLPEQRIRFQEFNEEIRPWLARKPPVDAPALILMPAVDKIAGAVHRNRALLTCAIVAVAAERYRLRHGKWPESLEKLPPDLLPISPIDPLSDGLVRYRVLPDGVIVYSVGRDGEDNDGDRNLKNPIEPGTDIVFRLWNSDLRRGARAESGIGSPKP
jgi:hypothetical protein